jgi:ABC-type transport system involved in cytochrome bd biosynthesis fused ATPase/permease subunit
MGIIGIVGLAVSGVGGISVEGIVPALVGFFMVQQSIGSFIQLSTRIHEFIPIARHYFNKSDHWQESVLSESDNAPLDAVRNLEFSEARFLDGSKQVTGWSFRVESGCIYGVIARKAPVFDLLIAILTRSSLPLEGSLLINGKDLMEYSSRSLFPNIVYLSSNIPVLPLTIRENIRIANKSISGDKLNHIVSKLNLGELLSDLPDGLETDLRQRDIKLSPSQEAALGAARLMASSGSLYIIDMRVLRSLPAEHFTIVMEYLIPKKDNSIIFLIPSRIEDLKYCERILLFKRYDLLFHASRRDLEDNIQRNDFYINPHPEVCIARRFSENPEKHATFERAVYSYENQIQDLDEPSVGASNNIYKNEFADDFKDEQLEQEMEDEMELG